MNNSELEYLATYTLQEHKTILDIVRNRSIPVAKTDFSRKRVFDNQIDSVIYTNLRTALASEDSEYIANPKKSCLRTAIKYILTANKAQLAELSIESGAEHLDDTDREAIGRLERIIRDSSYTDTELFGDYDSDNDDLSMTRLAVFNTLTAIPMLEATYEKMCVLCADALATSQRLKRFVSSELEQEDESSAVEISELKESIRALEECLRGERQLTYMSEITFPNTNAKCVCGACGSVNDARNIIKAKSYSADIRAYADAANYAQNAILAHNATGDITTSQLAARMGYISPVVCKECGAVNIVSGLVMVWLKRAVQQRWSATIPPKNNNNSICLYSASVIKDMRDSYLDEFTSETDTDNDTRQLIESALPKIHQQTDDIQHIETTLTDLFSAETYETFLAELDTDIGSSVLYNADTRAEYILRYLISQLHFTTIGSTPLDVIHTLLVIPQFADLRDEIFTLAQTIADLQNDLVTYKILQSLHTSNLIGVPIAGYQDQIITTDTVKRLISELKSFAITKEALPTIETLNKCVLDVSLALAENKQRAIDIAQIIHDRLLKLECEFCDQPYLQSFKYLDLSRASEDAIWISAATDTENILVTTGVADCMWEVLKDCYETLLTQTLFTKIPVLAASRIFFNGVLLHTRVLEDSRRLIARLTDTTMAKVSIQSGDNRTQDIANAARKLIVAVCKCSSMADITANLGITDEMLLKQHVTPLPTFDMSESLIFNETIDDLGFGKLELFSQGYSIEQYSMLLCNASSSSEDNVHIDEGEAVAYSEVAATLFCALVPENENVPKLLAELKEYAHARDFTVN